MKNDLINGFFELFSALLIFINVKKLYKDKQVRGVSWQVFIFFTLWGYWNLYYYPTLDQWLSFTGGVVITIANTAWIWLAIKYRKN